ncbi:hypothetical protein [Xenorhabdus miraniensis]|uniref:Peptidase C39-like domain-containing protein n=1 Tax=Xenorhabdus miraniensis TaxID=351674 RepID=A0A2D0JSB5_9GAMM|nr:hypothetical protein [Xenorhabdus miraniensis]PHM49183.1 hypothetical protein Xmir_01539 [Xenorhabdus miraniensis]
MNTMSVNTMSVNTMSVNTMSVKSLPQCLSFTKVDVKTAPANIHSSQLDSGDVNYGTGLVKNGYGQLQEQTHWCWVACAASVGSYYMGEAFALRQEAIYEMAKDLPLNTCNDPPRSYPESDERCNGTGWPSKALSVINIFSKEISGQASNIDMSVELIDGRPIVFGVRFSYGHQVDGAYGHAIVLSDGFNTGEKHYWQLFDPMYGVQVVNLSDFPAGYRGDPLAYWWFTDYTKKPL